MLTSPVGTCASTCVPTGGWICRLLHDHPSTMLRTSLTSTAITTNSSGVRQTELR